MATPSAFAIIETSDHFFVEGPPADPAQRPRHSGRLRLFGGKRRRNEGAPATIRREMREELDIDPGSGREPEWWGTDPNSEDRDGNRTSREVHIFRVVIDEALAEDLMQHTPPTGSVVRIPKAEVEAHRDMLTPLAYLALSGTLVRGEGVRAA